jgi:hypothetical protein
VPPSDLEKLTRTTSYDGKDVVVMRPGLGLVLYSMADLGAVMAATAKVLLAYLDFIPPGAIAASYHPGPNEYTPGRWVAFDVAERARLLGDLQSGGGAPEDDGYGIVLSPTADGQAGNYGFTFGGSDIAPKSDETGDSREDEENETSFLRLELPWNSPATMPVTELIDFIERAAALFPFCAGNAGMRFLYTISRASEARHAIDALLPRFLGFDCSGPGGLLEMGGKTPPADWINLLDWNLVNAIGGEEKLRSELEGCETRRLENGLLIRAAKFPPVVDVNRGGLDIGCLPIVARAIKPIRFDVGLFTGLPDAERGQEWLERFDDLAPGDWNNG